MVQVYAFHGFNIFMQAFLYKGVAFVCNTVAEMADIAGET
jgi:hypothetical protein